MANTIGDVYYSVAGNYSADSIEMETYMYICRTCDTHNDNVALILADCNAEIAYCKQKLTDSTISEVSRKYWQTRMNIIKAETYILPIAKEVYIVTV